MSLPFTLLRGATVVAAAAFAGVLAAAVSPAVAEEHEGVGRGRVPLLPAYVQECGACHLPFAPGLLPAASWQRLLANLPRHFGTDASLEPAPAREIGDWLALQGRGGSRSAAPPEDRITRAAWFVRAHDEVPAAAWQRKAVQRPAHCAACHLHADQGDFNERDVRIPR